MKDELTEKMHSEFTIDAETDKMHKCFAVWRHVGLSATTEELKVCIEFSGVTFQEVLKYKNQYIEILTFDERQKYYSEMNQQLINNRVVKSDLQKEIDIVTYLIYTCSDLSAKNSLVTRLERLEEAQFKENERLKDLQHIENIKALEQPTPEQIRHYNYDREMISRVYDYCIYTKLFNCDFWVFVKCIDTANFKKLYYTANDKSKIKHLIFQLQHKEVGKIGDVWYTNTAISIGKDKKRFTGFELSEEWKAGLLLEICPKNQQKKY